MNYLPRLAFLFLLILLIGCKKDNEDLPEVDFVVGETSSRMIIHTYDSTIYIRNWDDNFSFDIDQDGINDFRIISVHVTSPGGINDQEASVEILNKSIEISSGYDIDSIFNCSFYHNDTLYSTSYFNRRSGYECYGNETFLRIDTTIHPLVYSKGSTVRDLIWKKGNIVLSHYVNDAFWLPPPHHNYILYGNWNNANMKYVVFRINGSETRYGWLKLSILDYHEILFYEYAYYK